MERLLSPTEQEDLQWYFSRSCEGELGKRAQQYEVLGTGTADVHAMHVEPRTRLAVERVRRIEARVHRLGSSDIVHFAHLFRDRRYDPSLERELYAMWGGRKLCLAGLALVMKQAKSERDASGKSESLPLFLTLEFSKRSPISAKIKAVTLARLHTLSAAFAATREAA
jgi:hypothetical protein